MDEEFEDERSPVELAGFEIDAFVLPRAGEVINRAAERVGARECWRWGVVEMKEGPRVVRSETLGPALPEPIGVGLGDGWVCLFEIEKDRMPAEAGTPHIGHVVARRSDAPCLIKFSQVTTEDGVDEAGLGAEAETLGEFDRFVDGGVFGDAVEEKDLVEAEAEKNAEDGLLLAVLSFAIDQEIECALAADAAVGEFDGEAAVLRAEIGGNQFFFGDIFDEIFAAFATLENPHGNFSWFLPAHSFKMPLP